MNFVYQPSPPPAIHLVLPVTVYGIIVGGGVGLTAIFLDGQSANAYVAGNPNLTVIAGQISS